MSFRDAAAALERIAVLERENDALRDELEALRIENATLRADAETDKDAVIAALVAERDALAAELEDAGEPVRMKEEEEPPKLLRDKMADFLNRLGRL